MISFMRHYLLNIVTISSWKRYNSSMSSVPIDTVSRGRLRLWKRAARQRYEHVIHIFESDAFGKITGDFTRKHGVGRRRALARLKHMLKEARFVQVRCEDPVHTLWAVLEPSDSVICAGPDVGPGLLQDCVVVSNLVAGRLSRPDGTPHLGRCGPGLWALEVQDHALGRLLQRDPGANIDAVLWEAHTAALNINIDQVIPTASFFLRAGNGGFLAQIEFTRNRDDTSLFGLHIQCRTWLHQDAMHQTRVPLATTTTIGARIGDNLLIPVCLRHLARTTDGAAAETFFAKARELSDLQRAT
jgi:hypothetical protein